MPADIFVSYARSSSADRAERICAALASRGVSFFLDREQIATGDVFPERLVDGLLDCRLVLMLIDDAYFDRPWCVLEFQVALAPYRAAGRLPPGADPLAHVALALALTDREMPAHLPPPLLDHNWPKADAVEQMADLVAARLARSDRTLRQRLTGCEHDPAVMRLRGGTTPIAGRIVGRPFTASRVPRPLRDGFVGRTQQLWHIFNILETGRRGNATNACAIVGTAGVGKTQLAAEFVWAYGPAHYPAGVIWIDADVDERSLETQLRDVLGRFAPTLALPAPGDREELDRALGRLVAGAAAKGQILWVVDSLPLPQPGRRSQALRLWCPVLDLVDLLCTTRRGRLFEPGVLEPDSIVVLRELSTPAAIELITRPPVVRTALADDEWRSIAEWVGCLPLALRILHATLGRSDPRQVLARARGDEPATMLDADVEKLAEDVPADYLRGVAEALQDAYMDLRGWLPLLQCAHRMAWLAPLPTPLGLTVSWAPHEQLAQLANRGWIDLLSDEDGGSEVWRMHRVVSSFLRTRSEAPLDELASLAQWLVEVLPSGSWVQWILHADAVLDELGQRGPQAAAVVPPNLRKPLLALAGGDLTWPQHVRLQAVRLLSRWGEAEALLALVRNLAADTSPVGLAGVAAMLPAIGGAAAAALCAEQLRSPLPGRRLAALAAAVELAADPDVGAALVDAVLAASDHDRIFDELPDAPTEVGYVHGYALMAIGQDGKHQTVNWNHPFWGTVDAGPPCEALIGLTQHPNSLLVADNLTRALRSAPDDETKAVAIVRLGFLLRAMSTPIPAKLLRNWVLDRATGAVQERVTARAPMQCNGTPEHYAALVAEVLHGSERISRLAVKASFFSPSGQAALSRAVHGALQAGAAARALRIAEVACAVFPGHLNALWWRALALARLQRDAEALTDLGRVLGQNDVFFDARLERAALFLRRGDAAAVRREIDLAAPARDGYVQLSRVEYYFHLGEPEAARQAAEIALQLEPANAMAWVARACAFAQLSRPDLAIADARQARALGAQHRLIDQLLGPGTD